VEGPRRVRREEVAELSALLCSIFGFDSYHNMTWSARSLLRPIHRRGARVIAEDGRPVSHILTTVDEISLYGCRLKVASIGAVGTHPAYRNRGYASLILQESLQAATAAGARVLIVSGDRGLYRRNHCARVGDLLAARVRRDSLRQADVKLTARRVAADDWPVLSPLYSAEPVRFMRGADFFSQCCCWWDCTSPEVWRLSSEGKPVAYLCLLPPWREEHRRVRTLGEYAGSRAAIVDALPIIFEKTNIEEINLTFSAQDEEFIYLLGRRGMPLKATTLPGTHRLLNLPGLMRDLRPYLAARLPRPTLRQLSFDQDGEACRFSLGQQRTEMDLSGAAKLVLGAPDAPQVSGDLGAALSALFPIPFPMAGFNYV
jgi:predicted N-acetyltransferase YhbS